jgi:hypothetical protein
MLWVGSTNGLYRFDGKQFELFQSPFGDELLSTNIRSLYAPPSGGLWIGYTFGGLSFLESGRLRNYGGEFAANSGSIDFIIQVFVARFAKEAGKDIRHIGRHTLEQLKNYPWAGNIRELQNVVERAVILCEGDTFVVDESWLKNKPADSPQSHDGLSTLAERELEMIEVTLSECHGRISGPSGAAVKLGIPRQTLESKIRRFGIDKYRQKRSNSR